MSSYKDILSKNQAIDDDIIKYNYDEIMTILCNDMKRKPKLEIHFTEETLEYMSEQNNYIYDIFKNLKENYSTFGFLNDMLFQDFNEIFLKNVEVETLIEENEENELSFDDEEW
jgi:hypothetical protein